MEKNVDQRNFSTSPPMLLNFAASGESCAEYDVSRVIIGYEFREGVPFFTAAFHQRGPEWFLSLQWYKNSKWQKTSSHRESEQDCEDQS